MIANVLNLLHRGKKATLKELIDLMNSADTVHVVVAWATKNTLFAALKRAVTEQRVGHLVVGTSRYLTDPWALRQVWGEALVMPPDGDLFHPKLYVFEHKKSVTVVIGSSNLTSNAFDDKAHGNIELCAKITAGRDTKFAKQLMNWIQTQVQTAKQYAEDQRIDDDWLADYEHQYLLNRPRTQALTNPVPRLRPKRGRSASTGTTPRRKRANQSLFDANWSDFVAWVDSEGVHSPDMRLDVLDCARRIFVDRGTLVRMDQVERQAIAGTLGSATEGPGALVWGYFGSLRFTIFQAMINDRRRCRGISEALDIIPPIGPVNEEYYEAYRRKLETAFARQERRAGVPTMSRLLAMKRPDQFICVNRANSVELCEDLGVRPSTLSPENYWRRIIEPLRTCSWYISPKPTTVRERRIWMGRMALLDARYYRPI